MKRVLKYASGQVQIPLPKDGEAILVKSQLVPGTEKPATDNKNTKAKLTAIRKIATLKAKSVANRKDELDSFSELLADEMSPILQSFTGEVQQLVEQATSLDELSASLASLDLNVDEAIEVMQQAFFASELSGMYDVEQESE